MEKVERPALRKQCFQQSPQLTVPLSAPEVARKLLMQATDTTISMTQTEPLARIRPQQRQKPAPSTQDGPGTSLNNHHKMSRITGRLSFTGFASHSLWRAPAASLFTQYYHKAGWASQSQTTGIASYSPTSPLIHCGAHQLRLQYSSHDELGFSVPDHRHRLSLTGIAIHCGTQQLCLNLLDSHQKISWLLRSGSLALPLFHRHRLSFAVAHTSCASIHSIPITRGPGLLSPRSLAIPLIDRHRLSFTAAHTSCDSLYSIFNRT
jgi:hypothetical protein